MITFILRRVPWGGLVSSLIAGAILYGKKKKDGSHDHRSNRGNDRTPAQKDGDYGKRKSFF